jgi:hypothetical protein
MLKNSLHKLCPRIGEKKELGFLEIWGEEERGFLHN